MKYFASQNMLKNLSFKFSFRILLFMHAVHISHPKRVSVFFGGGEGIRTPDPLLAGQVLSQLSYTPKALSLRSDTEN